MPLTETEFNTAGEPKCVRVAYLTHYNSPIQWTVVNSVSMGDRKEFCASSPKARNFAYLKGQLLSYAKYSLCFLVQLAQNACLYVLISSAI